MRCVRNPSPRLRDGAWATPNGVPNPLDSRFRGNDGGGGLTGVGLRLWERGRPACNAALARGGTLILAFSHKGRRDPLVAVCT